MGPPCVRTRGIQESMADPNTQIDWWIAQAWQEAQGGAENDSLVAWLHENGLTAVSSYLILQAALSCPPEEAKEIVFSNPVWAGEDPDADLAGVAYTSDTLEPEPEPDPSFELDDWADQVEEDVPVYGEEGYQVDPSAGAARTDTEPASGEPNGLDQAGASGLAGDFDAGSGEPAEPAMETPDTPAEMPPAAPPPAPPPILRTPPTTPAERAARFAHAFHKETSDAEESPAPDAHSATRQHTEPPSSNAGPAVEAENPPARYAPEQPQTVPAGVETPPPLVYEPQSEIETPPEIPAGTDRHGDRPPDLRASPEDRLVDPEYSALDQPDEDDRELAPAGPEQEPPGLNEAGGDPADDREPDENAAAATILEDEAADTPPRPHKKVLLDPSGEAGEDGSGAEISGDMPVGDTPAELAEAARKLGIDFRGSSAADAGVDPEMARTAKELGISFRDDADPTKADLDETALEAQKLGISFRDGESGSGAPGKPLIVKYMPLILGIIIIFILLLVGAPFAGRVVDLF